MRVGNTKTGSVAVVVALVFIAWFIPVQVLAEDFQVRATVNAKRVGLDDDLELTISIQGDALGRAGTPQLPRLEGFRLGGQSTSTSVQFINGQMTSTRSVIYRLTPRSEGKHVIGPISVEYQGKEYLTEPIEIEVVSGSVVPRSGRGMGGGGLSPMDPFDMFRPRRRQPRANQGEVFVTAELSQPKTYVGEQVVLTYRLYSQVQVRGMQVDQQPPLTGFWVEEVDMPSEPQVTETEVEGKRFFTLPIKRDILFPTKVGKATIEPATFSMAVVDPSADPFFGRLSQTIRRSTKPLALEVVPLPEEGKPRNFSGAVGQFELSAKLDKEETTAGEPLTLSVRLNGRGNLRTVEAPTLPPPAGFRTYDPKMEEDVSAKGSGFGGEKSWEYVLVPDSAGRHRIGPLQFSYFDPAKKEYVELAAGPMTLDVAASTVVASGPGASSRGAVKLLRRDVRYLKPAPEQLGETQPPFYRSALFYASLALPLIWNLGLVVYRKKRESESAQADLWRSRRAQKAAQGRLKQARKLAQASSKDFYEETAAALYRYIADKLGVSPSGLTTHGIGAMLEARQVPVEVGSAFTQTIDACEFARFTPGERSRQEMESLLDKAAESIVSMEKHFQ